VVRRDAAVGNAATGGRERPVDGERGAVLVTFAVFLPLAMAIAALVFDAGFAWGLKRHLQASADAAALAGAQDLTTSYCAAWTAAAEYSGSDDQPVPLTGDQNELSEPADSPPSPCVASAVGRNYRGALERTNVKTHIRIFNGLRKIRVTQTADSPSWFANLLGFGELDVSATAVASRTSTSSGSPLAVYVHELCGASTGNKGFGANGKNMLIQGGIHVNGQFKIGDSGFRSESKTTVYRPPNASSPSPPGPLQGSCNGTAPLPVENRPDARYCTVECAPGDTLPTAGPWRDWITPYHTEAIVKTRVNNGVCTHPSMDDVTLVGGTAASPLIISEPRLYCLPPNKKFTLTGAIRAPGTCTQPNDDSCHARITVVAGFIEVNATGGKIKPFKENEPVLFYSTNTANTALKVNPSGALDWIGYVINRLGGLEINSGGVVSPRKGLLEAEWMDINGENFTMLGTAADTLGGTILGDVVLEE
jgi:Putative Flp pilus-assembly TadE/G-like